MKKDQVSLLEINVPSGYDQRWFSMTINGDKTNSLVVKFSGHAFISLQDKFTSTIDKTIIALGFEMYKKKITDIGFALADVQDISPEFLEKGRFEVTELSDQLFEISERGF